MNASDVTTRLARLRRRAGLVLWIEALSSAALPLLGVFLAYLLLVLLGLGGLVTEALALAALALALAGAMRRFQTPSPARIDRRIEQVTGLDHRPLAAAEDRLVPAGGLAQALWQAHQQRVAARIMAARTGAPHLRLAEHDPLGLRAGLLLGLLTAAIIAGPALPERLADLVVLPHWRIGQGVEVAAWLTPPRWTGEAPRLVGRTHKITALPGSRLSMVITGAGRRPPRARFAAHPLAFKTLGQGSFRASLVLDQSGTITAGPFWNRIARYPVTVTPLIPPSIAFAAPPVADPDSKRIDISYRAADHYGLKTVGLRVAPAAPQARPETVPVAANFGRVHAMTATARLDLLSSPYAGLPVEARLVAGDIAGGTARSLPITLTLPAPRLKNASARAIEALRQHLALQPAARPQVAQLLSRLAAAPPGPLTAGTDLHLAAFADALARRLPLAAHPVSQLWTLVQEAEQGHAYRTGKALARARAALSHALASMLAKHHIDQARLDRLLNKLNRALTAHMAALHTQNEHNANPAARPFDPHSIDRLAQRIAREERQGQEAEARRDLRKLQQMLRRLQSAKPMSAADKARAQAAAKAGSSLNKMVQGEAHLLGQTASAPHGTPPQSLAAAQQRLQQALQRLQQGLASAKLPRLPGLGTSGKAMGQAGTSLRQGDQPGAMAGERAAIASLQQAASALAKLGQGKGQQEGLSGLGQHGSGKTGQSGIDEHGSVDLKAGNKVTPARRIEQDIIHRDANPALPAPAHHYYHRLLGHQD